MFSYLSAKIYMYCGSLLEFAFRFRVQLRFHGEIQKNINTSWWNNLSYLELWSGSWKTPVSLNLALRKPTVFT